jgi:hypothetical protein
MFIDPPGDFDTPETWQSHLAELRSGPEDGFVRRLIPEAGETIACLEMADYRMTRRLH